MTLLDDFATTDSIRLADVRVDFVAPRLVGGIVVGSIPDGPTGVPVPCIPKVRGRLDATLVLLDLRIPFTGAFLGVDARGRWLVRWSVDDRTPRRLAGQTVERLRGQVTVELRTSDRVVTDLPSCSGTDAEYFVDLRTVPLAEQEPAWRPLPNELEISPAGAYPAIARDITFAGTAGLAAPPVPRPRPVRISMQTCVPWSPVARTVAGSVVLDGPVRRSHTGFTCTVTAEVLDPLRQPLPVQVRPPVGSTAEFTCVVPGGHTGRVRVTAYTDRREHSVSTELYVPEPGGLGCGAPVEAEPYEVLRVGCEAYDCGWTAMNDLAELAGRTGDVATRYLTARAVVDRFGRDLPGTLFPRAINLHGQVLCALTDEAGREMSAIYGEPGHAQGDDSTPAELRVVEDATLLAMNDAGEAVGYQRVGETTTAVLYAGGELRRLDGLGSASTATDLNDRGQVVGVYAGAAGKGLRSFLLEDGGGKARDLGDVGGVATVALAVNGAGAVVGFSQGKDGRAQPFAAAAGEALVGLKAPEGSTSAMAVDVNDAGVVVGTAWGGQVGEPRAFRFTAERGTEGLDALINPQHEITVLSAVCVNNVGQILVQGRQRDEVGYYLLNPASIPTPQVPIP